MINIIEGAFNNLLYKTDLLKEETKDVITKRLNTCRQCDIVYYDHILNSLRCGNCKCFIHFKTSNLNEKCPLNKW